MKKFIISMGFVLSAQGVCASQEDYIKYRISELGYPVVLMIREAKNMPEEDLISVVVGNSYFWGIGIYDGDLFKKYLEAVRTLSDADMAALKKEYDEKVQQEQEEIKKWNSPEAVAERKQAEVERETQRVEWEKQSQVTAAQRAALQAEALRPEVLAVINGFLDALDKDDVRAAAKNFMQQFIVQWKAKVDVQQRAKIQQIMALAIQASEIIQQVNGNIMKLIFGGNDAASQKLAQQFQVITDQLSSLTRPYEMALRDHISKEQMNKFQNNIPEIIQIIIEEFQKGKS